MWIEGTSCLGLFGCGPDALLEAIRSGTQQHERVTTERVKDYVSARALRQCEHFSRMALLGAYLALEDAGLSAPELSATGSCGLVLASGYGPAMPTFNFLDSVLDFGEAMASPLAFSHSVHIIPAAVIAKTMELVGPCASICQFSSSVASGLLTAQSWLAEGRVERVLFGVVEEATPALSSLMDALEQPHTEGTRIHGEGACFFCLSHQQGTRHERIEHILNERPRALEATVAALPDAHTVFASGTLSSLAAYADAVDARSAYGIVPISQAFDCAAAVARMRVSAHTNTPTRIRCDAFEGGMFSSIAISRYMEAE